MKHSLNPFVRSARTGEVSWLPSSGDRQAAFISEVRVGHIDRLEKVWRVELALSTPSRSLSLQCGSEAAAKQALEELTFAWLEQHFRGFLDKHRRHSASRPPEPAPG
jgi:hypothetical protein